VPFLRERATETPPSPVSIENSRTATPVAAEMFISLRLWTVQPHRASWRSMS
jgi:hypothetical protein